MTKLSDFFKESDTTLGVFYPKHYLVASFRDFGAAEQVAKKLQHAGFALDDVLAAGGKEIVDLAKENTGLGSFVMQSVSRFFATEQVYTDHDLEHARQGAGFLAVHCPTDDIKTQAWKIVKEEAPLDARYYAAGGIEHLAGDPDTD